MRTCSKCGEPIGDHQISCYQCGAVIGAQKMCKNCGREFSTNSDTCPDCGTYLSMMDDYCKNFRGDSDSPDVWMYVISFLVPLVGFIMGAIMCGNDKTEKGKPLIITALISIIVFVLVRFFLLMNNIPEAISILCE